jgi:hypothetical protein
MLSICNVIIIMYAVLPVLHFSGVNMLIMYLPDDGFNCRANLVHDLENVVL